MNRNGRLNRIVLVLLAVGCDHYVFASDVTANDPEPLHRQKQWWMHAHEYASKQVELWSSGIDSFLSRTDVTDPNDTKVDLKVGTIAKEGNLAGFYDIGAQFHFPNTRNKLDLVVESYGDSLDRYFSSSDDARALSESDQTDDVADAILETNSTAALRYDEVGWSADVGVLMSLPLDPYVRVRFPQTHAMTNWAFDQEPQVFVYNTKGVVALYSMEISNISHESLVYGLHADLTILAKNEDVYANQSFFVNQLLNEDNGLYYNVSFLQSRESDVYRDSFLYYFKYSHVLHDKWLIGEIKPQVTYESESHYQPEYSLTLALKILFGNHFVN
ncbi:hypothetical protein C0J08_20140 [Marinomonas sp. CT5]|uniref:hypothetical protein n=1 Tax=Marinomonas sp. CT5 TaxID=2066133 RepID=UPI001BB04E65|nr:hypothetical protein [Marinomonas sp. CT5]QUX97570.1 hypothetical protein C0J08_20140 [Marinomonas sp. CT5]